MQNRSVVKSVQLLTLYEKTGGPLSMHQLGGYLEKLNYNVRVLYCRKGRILTDHKPLFDDYRLCVADHIIDEESSVVIIPETLTSWRFQFKKARIIIWWLSLDYYRLNNIWWAAKWGTKVHMLPLCFYPVFLVRYTYKRLILRNQDRKSLLSDHEFREYIHLYNSEHARLFLKEHVADEEKLHYLCGPIDKSFVEKSNAITPDTKMDIVAYNPAKADKRYVNRIIKHIHKMDPGIKIVGIRNMNKMEVCELLKSAKVYFDLGYFPGPERIPREAVCMYCNIITSQNGSAGSNDKDVPIADKYKHDIYSESPKKISEQILRLISEYEMHVSEYDNYREKVLDQIKNFETDVEDVAAKYL